MKRLLAAAALAVPLFAMADHDLIIDEIVDGGVIIEDISEHDLIIRNRGDRLRAQQTAQELVQTLLEISREADRVSDQARYNGNIVRARRFADVAYISGNLAQDLRQSVLRPLRQGEPLHRVSNNLDRLQYQFADLNNAVNLIFSIPRHLEETLRDARALHQALKRLL